MSFGKDASLTQAIRQIDNTMRVSEGATIVETVVKCSSLKEAVDIPVGWFRGKICLFLVDDLWPVEHCKA